MKRKHLLLTLLMALMAPLAAFSQSNHNVTVYKGKDTNVHLPLDGTHGVANAARNQFIMDKAELGDIVGKPITKMTFYIADPVPTVNSGNHLNYIVSLAEVDASSFTGETVIYESEVTNGRTVAANVKPLIAEHMMEITFSNAYTYSGEKNLLVEFRCSSGSPQWYYSPWYESGPVFYGVNVDRAGMIDMGMGIYRHHGFVPRTTFTFQDEDTWAYYKRPGNLDWEANPNGTALSLSWTAPYEYSGNYQALCVEHGTTSLNWSNAITTTDLAVTFTDLEPYTSYDLYVRAKSGLLLSDRSKVFARTASIANLDEGSLTFDFDGAYVHHGITVIGGDGQMLDIMRYFYLYGDGYGSYFMRSSAETVNLPYMYYNNASNGITIDFDLASASDLYVRFVRGNASTDFGPFSASEWTHFTLHAAGEHSATHTFFQLISASSSFDIDNIVIRKASDVLPVTNLAVSNIGTTEATVSWADDNLTSHSLELYYRPKGYHNGEPQYWLTPISVSGTSHTLIGLDAYTEYEVMVKAFNSSIFENSAILSFATMCPTTTTPYSQYFTNLSVLPQYWRVVCGNGVEYSFDNNRLNVSNTIYSINNSYYTALEAYVILPYFENLASLQLSLKAGRTAGSYTELVVGVMSDPFDVSTFSAMETRILNGPSTTYNIGFANAAYTNGHIAIKLYNFENNLQSVWYDDFVVTRLTPPTDLTVSPTNNSVTLGWTTTAPSVEIQYRTTGGAWSESITPEGNPYTITRLTASTEYEAQIRANYGSQNSEWVSFPTITTYYSAPVLVDVTHPYSHGFQYYAMGAGFVSDLDGWQLINKGFYGNDWMIGTAPGTLTGTSGTNYSLYISYNMNAHEYVHRSTDNYGQAHSYASTVYATKVFTLAPGSYQFGYRWKCKGIHESDYFRVALVPANTVLNASSSTPVGLSYNTLPDGWIALDGGEALNPITGNLVGFDSYTTPDADRIPILEEGDYMMVFIWHNIGLSSPSAQNPPVAFDNVTISCSTIIYGPDYNCTGITDTEATLNLYAPGLGVAPTGYEVQYEPALDYNNYVDAPIVTVNVVENPQTVTLTGLTPKTLYNVRLRSVYTTNGHSIYSDWVDAASCFETKYPRPTDLTVVDQTTSWANVVWAPVEVNLAEGEYINYWWQLTTDPDDWGEYIGQGQVSNSWAQNFVPGTYYFRVSTAVYQENGNLFMGQSDWSEPLEFTIAPWTDPVTIFPLTNDFEAFPDHFADGLTLDGDYGHFDIMFYTSEEPTPGDTENGYKLRFHSCGNKTAYLVLPPLRPSTSDALVSFWWYHDSSINETNDGVIVEFSDNGSSWSSFGNMITRYAAESGWVKYQQVVPAAGTNPIYIRLYFVGSNSNQWTRCCYLDDLTVNNFKSEQPYISYVAPGENSVTLTLYDYAVENGYQSSVFEVQYREYREPGEPEEEWIDYPYFENEAPYTFENYLTLNGLQSTTYYEFRARARVSYGGFDFPWSNYCEPYRQWTECGSYIITPTQSCTMGFEDEYYLNCWTGDISETAWHLTSDEAHSGAKSIYVENNVTGSSNLKELRTPPIDLTQLYASTDNVVLRFWVNYTSSSNSPSLRMTSSVNVYNSSSTLYQLCQIPLNTDGWTQIELSLSKQMGDVITIGFKTAQRSHVMWYIDDIEIVANPYPGVKIFDAGGYNYASTWTSSNVWYPNGVPTASEDVMILEGSPSIPHASYNSQVKSIVIGHGGDLYSPTVASSLTVIEGVETHSRRYNLRGEPNNALSIGATTTFTAQSVTIASECPLQVSGIANITTLNPGAANSVIVNDGGVLNATTITGANAGANDKVVIKDGGQVKAENTFYATIEKDITGYGAENVSNSTGWYLVAPTTLVMAVPTFVPHIGSEPQFDQIDFYWFDGHQELEWYNPKCPADGGCESPWGIIPQGHFSAEVGQPLHGYLYASQEDGTLQFAAGIVNNTPFPATNVDTNVDLDFYSNTDAPLNGWNLIGNPYTCNAYLLNENNEIIPFYRMNETGDAIVAAQPGTPIKPCEGVFVVCPGDGLSHHAVFTTTAPATVGTAHDDPEIMIPVHALLGNQDAASFISTLTQTIELAAGANWVSFYVDITLDDLKAAIQTALPGTTATATIMSKLSSVKYSRGRWAGQLNALDLAQMYVITVSSPCEIVLEGLPVDPTTLTVTIVPGVNWIAYPFTTSSTPTNLFSGFAINDDQVRAKVQSTKYNRGRWAGQLTTLEPGQGYVYISAGTTDRTFMYPVLSKDGNKGALNLRIRKQ